MKFFKKYKGQIFISLAIIISLVIFLFRNQLFYIQGLGYFGIFLLSLIGNATVILPIPALATTFLGAIFLNPILVALVSSLGATIGELTGYLAGMGGEELLKKDKRIKKVESWMKKYGLWTIFFLAAIPNPLFDLAGMVAGASRVPVRKYLIVVFAGKTVKFLLVAYLGFGISLIG